MSYFSQAEMQSMWVQAGGSSSVSSLMSAIFMAESNGNSDAVNADSGACGLAQIYPCEPGASDPFTNMKIAVRKYNSQGLSAWQAYTNGAYKRFYNGSVPTTLLSANMSSSSSCASPLIFGNCPDQFVGLGAMILGVGLIAGFLLVVVLNTKETQQTLKLATTAAKVLIK